MIECEKINVVEHMMRSKEYLILSIIMENGIFIQNDWKTSEYIWLKDLICFLKTILNMLIII